MTTITVWILVIFTFSGSPSYVSTFTVIDNIASQQECEALKIRLWPKGTDKAQCNYVVKVK